MTAKVGKFASKVLGAVLLVSSLIASSALAQGTSVLTGNVTDAATRLPVTDAVVTATSPTFQGEQIAVTDATGFFRIPQLTPGTYSLRVEKEAYRPYSRGDIDVRADITLRLNVELLPEAIKGEEVLVVGRAPTVDVASSSLSTNVSSEMMRNLALSAPSSRGGASRSFESLALVAPTATSDLYGVSINGTTSPENGYLVDGISVSNPGFGVLGSPISSEFMEEVNVITGGYLPEFGRSQGGVLSAVTKSGSNEFHGSVYGSYVPGFAQGSPEVVRTAGSTTSFITTLHNVGDLGATVGGPIMKDKLWFFAGIQPSAARFQLEKDFNVGTAGPPLAGGLPSCLDPNGVPVNPSLGRVCATRKIPGAEQFFFADQKALNYIGKVTYLVNQDHRISLAVIGTPSTSGGRNSYPFAPASGLPVLPVGSNAGTFDATTYKNNQGSTDTVLKVASSFLEKHLLLDATAGYHHEYNSRLPVDGTGLGSSDGLAGTSGIIFRRTNRHSITDFETNNPLLTANCDAPGTTRAVLCPVTTYRTGGPGFINDATYDIWQGKLMGTYFLSGLGHHVLKAGVDGKYLFYNHLKAYSGQVLYRESRSGSLFNDYRQYGVLDGPDNPVFYPTWSTKTKTYVAGGFLQDSWSIMDTVTLSAGVRYDTQVAFGADGKEALRLPKQWSPRIGLIYDFTQQGRSKVYANFARFFEDIPLDAFDREFPGERQIVNQVGRRCNPAVTPNNCRDNRSLLPSEGTTDVNQLWIPIGGDTAPVDPNLSAASMDEFVAGAEYEILPSGRIGASFTRRYIVRAIEDMSNDEAQTYFLGNPGYGVAANFPKAARNYNAWTIYFNKMFADSWLGQVSYTYSTLNGNYQGLFLAGQGQLDPNITSDFDLVSLLPNRHDRLGPLPADINHQIKLFGAKEVYLTGTIYLSLGVSYSTRSGRPIDYLGSHPLYGPGEVYILPRGSGGRLPWIHNVDPHLGVNYRLSRDSTLTVNVDVFNVFNFQRATAVDNNYTLQNVLPIAGGTPADLVNLRTAPTGGAFDPGGVNPNFKNPTAYQAPRSFRFGARITF